MSRKNMRGMQLKTERVLPAEKLAEHERMSGSTIHLSSAVLARCTRFFVQSPRATRGPDWEGLLVFLCLYVALGDIVVV